MVSEIPARQPLRVALLNDHPLILEGLRAMLRPHACIDLVELDARMPVQNPVDVALLDIHAQSTDLPTTIRQRLAEDTVAKLVVYAWNLDDTLVADALSAGASGALSKTLGVEQLVQGLRRVACGEQVVDAGVPEADDLPATQPARRGKDWPGRSEGLSMREAEMITLISQGLSNDQIARQLYLSPNSVKTYIRTAYQKIRVTSRSQAVIWGIEHGLRPTPERREG